MSDNATVDDAKSTRSKTFAKQLSKSFQKGKEAVKRGLLTPRGVRASSAKGDVDLAPPETKLPPSEMPPFTEDPKVNSKDLPSKSDAAPTDVDIKATVKPSGHVAAPLEVVLTPNEPPVPEGVTGPATPAAAPSLKQIHVEEPIISKAPPVSKAQPAQEAGEEAELAHEEVETDAESVMQGGNLAIAPPNVRVTIKGIPEEGDKAVVILTSPEEGRPIGQGKEAHNARKALIGLLALAAASAAAVAVRGMQAH